MPHFIKLGSSADDIKQIYDHIIENQDYEKIHDYVSHYVGIEPIITIGGDHSISLATIPALIAETTFMVSTLPAAIPSVTGRLGD